jgi:peptide/nickel transport system substrate-binding protein
VKERVDLKRNWLGIYVLLIALFFTFPISPAGAEKDKEVKLGITQDERSLNPYTYKTGFPGLELVNLFYDPLFVLDKNNKPIPWLVKEFTISEDGKQYKMILHDNITWQDGKPLTSEDVKFTYEYVLTYKKSRFSTPASLIKSIQTPDKTTVIMELGKPEPDFFIQPLADLPILPKHIWSTVTDPDNFNNTLGSGPFILEEYKKDQFYKLKANPNYFKGKPAIDTLVIPIIQEANAMFTALKAGQLDVISRTVQPELVKEFESIPSIKLEKGPGFATSFLQFNAEKFPMSDQKFRQAVSLAIDPQYLVDTVLLGFGEKGSPGFIHPATSSYNKAVVHKTDVEQAKSILEQAGFKDKDNDGLREAPDGKKIELVNLVQSNNPTSIRSAEIIAEWMKKIGINVKVRPMDPDSVISLVWPEYDVTKGRNYDMTMFGWSTTMQMFPARLVDLFYSDLATKGGTNIGGFKSAAFDKLADQLEGTYDPEQRKQIIDKMQEQVASEYPIVPLYYAEVINAYNSAKYSGWVFQDGKGIINKLSFVTNSGTSAGTTEQPAAAPATATATATAAPEQSNTSTGKGTNSILIILGILVVVAGGWYWLSRTKTKS